MRFGWDRAASVAVMAALTLSTAACGRSDAGVANPDESAKAAAFFLRSNATVEGVKTTASGLQYKIVQSGPAGPSPDINDLVRLHYEGSLTDGTVFDSSFERGTPYVTAPEGAHGSPIIPGWTEVLQLMKPGDEWIVYVPPELGYGAEGAGGVIPPNAVLVFRIQVLDMAHTPDATRTIMPMNSAQG